MGFWDIVGGLGQVAGGAAGGAAQGRRSEAEIALEQQRLAAQMAQQGAQTELQRRLYTLGAPLQRARAGIVGSGLANVQDVSLQGAWKNPYAQSFTGGMRPSMLTPETRELGTLMSTRALEGQKAGDQFAAYPSYSQIKQENPIPKAGFWEKAGGLLGLGGNLLGALGQGMGWGRGGGTGGGTGGGGSSDEGWADGGTYPGIGNEGYIDPVTGEWTTGQPSGYPWDWYTPPSGGYYDPVTGEWRTS